MKFDINHIFSRVSNVVFGAILLVLILAMSIGVVKMFLNVWNTFLVPGVTGKYLDLITDVLTLFVLVEMSKSLVDYFHTHRLRMTFIVDAAIVFFIREIMIMAFQHKTSPAELYAFSALLLVLTILRIGSIFMFQRELQIIAATDEKIHAD
ncbi:Uncharacterized membrane protein, DUF373 family [Malonomonas rubra DSM 5091]|uniref:Uncharacterized membrane protein, DUF373 family n=1 Tax=Malonomonas rubra DSM 5091 TaxID=1122189 RepID=A0A1M6KPU3_MALRU|nr:phosphate-starvation-inducible PsiE family protein [Malonomonas rubra]SHJ61008.1 Uncharacterized membrane protein, DUF373 family [Malonomonas rubra DSM 5091]